MAKRTPGIEAPGSGPVKIPERAEPSKSRIRQDSGTFHGVFKTSFTEMQEVSFKKQLFASLPAPPVHRASQPASSFMPLVPPVQAGVDPFREAFRVVMKHEGKTYVARDGVESSKMGMLQSTARSLGYQGDIRNLTMADAEKLYRKLWDKSGAASLPYPLSVVHFDTFVNSPTAARKMLRESGGDTDTYLSMREQRFQRLAAHRPERFGRYINGWMNRVASLKTYVAAVAKHGDTQVTIASNTQPKKIS
jgi:hypothetical protein